MKDFKKMPKMACGGGVNKYSEGGDVIEEVRKAVRAGKDLDPGMMAKSKPRTMNIGGKDVALKATPMPTLSQDDEITIPGIGKAKPAPMQTRGNLQLLKKGSKVKRGNKKK
jgi:hypothetical protein